MRRKLFVDREAELQQLEQLQSSPGFALIFVYGRSRVGKTRLLTEFVREKTSVYLPVAKEITDEITPIKPEKHRKIRPKKPQQHTQTRSNKN
ncbi:MAG: ATP-binding protein [Candidatus Jordarchaeum sp.]|uniref:ATP-binding protein n=1 Tax=Candidatus Jordarchaeum sp. TaxID=2823881 RepID=UPI0040493A2C